MESCLVEDGNTILVLAGLFLMLLIPCFIDFVVYWHNFGSWQGGDAPHSALNIRYDKNGYNPAWQQ